MYGIAGLAGRAPQTDPERILGKMQNALRHRSPDGEGIYLSADRRAGFVHARLAVLNLSANAHQPMSSPDGSVTIVLSGEIYNFRELRKDLRALCRAHSGVRKSRLIVLTMSIGDAG